MIAVTQALVSSQSALRLIVAGLCWSRMAPSAGRSAVIVCTLAARPAHIVELCSYTA